MGGERLPLGFEHTCRVDEQSGYDPPPHGIPQAVRHPVVHGHLPVHRRTRRRNLKVGHASREGGRHRQARGVGVILHVILRRMREHDSRVDLTDDRGQVPQMLEVVKNLKIAREGRVECCAEKIGGFLRLGQALGFGS